MDKDKINESENNIEKINTILEESKESLSKIKKTTSDAAIYLESLSKNDELVKNYLTKTETNRDEITRILTEIKKEQENINIISSHAEEKDNIINELKIEIKKHINDYKDLIENIKNEKNEKFAEINDLLPGATSAGLAKAFNTRKNDLKKNIKIWFWIRLLSTTAFIILGLIMFSQSSDIKTFSSLILFAIKRSPVIAGLVLLEEFARRQFNIQTRLEEDYAYKEVLSKSYVGYSNQLEEIDIEGSKGSSKLSKNLLEAISQEPGRLIDKEKNIKSLKIDDWEAIASYAQQKIKNIKE